MCGLTSVISHRSSHKNWQTLVKLTQDSLHRGKDASGFAWIDDENKKIVYAKGQSEPEALAGALKVKPSVRIGIGHVRQMTIGEPTDNDNNHPIALGNMVLAHNGMITNTFALETKYPQMKMKGKVDSRWILWLIQHHLKTTKDISEAIQKTTKDLSGSYAFLLLVGNEPNKLYAVAHTRPLEMVYLPDKKVAYIASESGTLKKSLIETVSIDTLIFESLPNLLAHTVLDDTGMILTMTKDGLKIEKTFQIEPLLQTLTPLNQNLPIDDISPTRRAWEEYDYKPPIGFRVPPTKKDTLTLNYLTIWVRIETSSQTRIAHQIDLTANSIDYNKVSKDLMNNLETWGRYQLVVEGLQTAMEQFRGKRYRKILRKLTSKLWAKYGSKLRPTSILIES